MADAPKPHTVPRKPAGEPPAKQPVEARPTSKLDRNELLGLVGNMRKPPSPTVEPYDADAEVEIERTTDSPVMPIRTVAAVQKRIVRTVARRTPIAGIAPLVVEPVSAPAPVTPKPPNSDEYIDLFAEGSDTAIDVAVTSPATTPAVDDRLSPPAAIDSAPAVASSVNDTPSDAPAVAPPVHHAPTNLPTDAPPVNDAPTDAPAVAPSVHDAPSDAEALPPTPPDVLNVAPSSTMPSKRTLQLAAIGVLVLLVLVLLIGILR